VTAPTSSPPTCILIVDGVRYPDGQPVEPVDDPVALTDLTITWGRSTTLDQPRPATCTFTVLDLPGGRRFADTIHVGSRVQVQSDATIYPDPTIPTIADPGFEAAAVDAVPSVIADNATARVVAAPVHAGARAVRLDPVNPARRMRVIFPPEPLSATHNPAAWDAVPRTLPGQSWRYGAAVRVPAAIAAVAGVILRPVTFTQPWAGPGVTVLDQAAPDVAPDAAGWRVLSATVTPPAGVWLGVCVDVFPTGPTWDQAPPALTWDQVDPTIRWNDLAATYVDDLVMLAPAAGASRAGEVFTGRVTDMVAQWDPARAGTVVDVTAQDDTAELGNRYVGAEPWSVESLDTRFGRVLTASGQDMRYTVDASVAGVQVTYRDVDNQPSRTLLAELAQSVAGALWSATSLTTGPYLRLEDINGRAPLQVLVMDGDGVIRIEPAPVVGERGITLDACDVLLDPVSWHADGTDQATRVAVGWKDQTVDPVKPVDRTETVVDAAAELANGQRRVQISTQLADQVTANEVAQAVLGRLGAGGWRIAGLTVRLTAGEPLTPDLLATVMTVLDATSRIGLGIMLTGLPEWSPAGVGGAVPLYLEGGQLANHDGAWTLDLVTSSAKAQGAGGVQWNQLPAAWTWDQVDPAIRWNDLRGVGI
jgi:hypothetical protein